MVRLEPRPTPGAPDLRGIHHRLAELNRLDQQIKHLEEELEKLDNTDRASTVCREVLLTIDNKPDAFLPTTRGPENAAWKQWFEKKIQNLEAVDVVYEPLAKSRPMMK